MSDQIWNIPAAQLEKRTVLGRDIKKILDGTLHILQLYTDILNIASPIVTIDETQSSSFTGEKVIDKRDEDEVK